MFTIHTAERERSGGGRGERQGLETGEREGGEREGEREGGGKRQQGK